MPIKKICLTTPKSAQIGGVHITGIDGQPVRVDPSETIELLPGIYSVDVTVDIEFFLTGYKQKVLSREPVTMEFVCEGGNAYLVNYTLRYNEDQYSLDWEPFIENITSRPDVKEYIRKREDTIEAEDI